MWAGVEDVPPKVTFGCRISSLPARSNLLTDFENVRTASKLASAVHINNVSLFYLYAYRLLKSSLVRNVPASNTEVLHIKA